ncbi:alpha/beta fold hydrolase [Glaciibacter superstes]|uniref:alpha/beta fold hydrolase n=1 Tax=Glaciibacter superstes TaxID=501023 RepID=UPI0003B67F28|nr:alpha/beta hydrolase [Glaciibacter superstes]
MRTAYELNRVNVVHAEEDPTALPLDPPAFDRLTDIEVPTLITVGEYDLTHHLAEYEFLLSTIPTASGCTFRDTAHLPNVEQAADFERVLLGWLAENQL